MKQLIVFSVCLVLLAGGSSEANWGLAGRKIVVDPGHGGRNPGAVGPTGLREADANCESPQLSNTTLKPGEEQKCS